MVLLSAAAWGTVAENTVQDGSYASVTQSGQNHPIDRITNGRPNTPEQYADQTPDAEPWDINPTPITGIQITQQPTTVGSTARVDVTWALNHVESLGRKVIAGDYFTLKVPDVFSAVPGAGRVNLQAPDGELVAECDWGLDGSQAMLKCVFTEWVESHENEAGNIYFAVQARKTMVQGDVIWEANGSQIITGIGGIIEGSDRTEFVKEYLAKDGGQIEWSVIVPVTDAFGIDGSSRIISDSFSPNQEWAEEFPRVYQLGERNLARLHDKQNMQECKIGSSESAGANCYFLWSKGEDGHSFKIELLEQAVNSFLPDHEPVIAFEVEYWTKISDEILPFCPTSQVHPDPDNICFVSNRVQLAEKVREVKRVYQKSGGAAWGDGYAALFLTKQVIGSDSLTGENFDFVYQIGEDADFKSLTPGSPVRLGDNILPHTTVTIREEAPSVPGFVWKNVTWELIKQKQDQSRPVTEILTPEEGEVSFTAEEGYLYTLRATNEFEPEGAIRLFKVDGDGQPGAFLGGAVFELWMDTNGNGTIDIDDVYIGERRTADETGMAQWGGLASGQYLLKEIEAPSGYMKSENVWIVSLQAEETDEPYSVTTQIANSRILGSVTWAKVAAGVPGDTRYLQGSEWLLTDPLGSTVVIRDCLETPYNGTDSQDTDCRPGRFLVNDLQWGEYQLQELKAPDGYQISERVIHFEIGPESGLSFDLGELANSELPTTELPGTELPTTGGIGRSHLAISVVAVLLLVAGIAVSATRHSTTKY